MRPALILLLLLSFPATAQRKDSALERERKEFAAELRALQKELRQAVEDYKASLQSLIVLREQEVTRTRDRLKKSEELYAANLITHRTLEEDKVAVSTATGKLTEAKDRLARADDEVKNLEDPDELARQLITRPARRERTPTGRVYLVRFIVIGEVEVYDYTGAVRGRVIKHRNRVRYDSRK